MTDDLIRRLRTWRTDLPNTPGAECHEAADRIEQLEALVRDRDQAIEQALYFKKDAARYRWLRKDRQYGHAVVHADAMLVGDESIVLIWETLDNAIDAAMSKEGK